MPMAAALVDVWYRDLGYVAGQVFAYAFVVLAVVASVIWLVRRRRD